MTRRMMTTARDRIEGRGLRQENAQLKARDLMLTSRVQSLEAQLKREQDTVKALSELSARLRKERNTLSEKTRAYPILEYRIRQQYTPVVRAAFRVVLRAVASLTGVPEDLLLHGFRGKPKTVRARWMLYTLLVENVGLSHAETGRLCGRHHTSVSHGIMKARQLCKDDAAFALDLHNLKVSF